MEAGEDAAQMLIRLFERFGIPLAQRSKQVILKAAKYGGSKAIKTPGAIANIFRDTKTEQMAMESKDLAMMKKIAMVKTMRGVRGGSIEMMGSHLWFSKRVAKRLENNRTRKKVERYVVKLQKDPERFEKEWEKYGHDKTSFNDHEITFNTPEEAVAAQYVYKKELLSEKNHLGEISCLGSSLFITKAVSDKLQNPIRNRRFQNEIDRVMNSPELMKTLMTKQQAKESQFMEDIGKAADEVYAKNNPDKVKNEKNTEKKKQSTTKETAKKNYRNPKHDPVKSNAQVAKQKSVKTDIKTKGNR